MLLFEPLMLSIIFTPISYVIKPNFLVLLPSAYSSARTAVKFCPIFCFAAMTVKLCFWPKVMLFLPCQQQELVLSCGAAGRDVFSSATAMDHNPTHVGKDVAGRSVPSPLGGTVGEKILCNLHSYCYSTLFTFLLPVHF